METSLIGKALNFGFNEYGFESHVSKVSYTHAYSHLLSVINIRALQKSLRLEIVYTKAILNFLKFFQKNGVINSYALFLGPKNQLFIKIYLVYYKKLPLSSNCKIITKPSKQYFISYKALMLLSKRTFDSVYLISTDLGLLSHHDAIRNRRGGVVVSYFSL